MTQMLRKLSDISFPLTRRGRTLIDAEGVEICTVTKENISPVAGDELAALVCRLLNDAAARKLTQEI